ncbi:hypothetical protein VTJ49DRAFT_940 [Mycothermus thermophilus]|uniref:Uncharacterized protein n=1 Tax=Humicola insolens TaxID=85995 RepID=A0ABR3VE40_HUMIN
MRSLRWLAASLPVALASVEGIAVEHVNPAGPVRTPSPVLQDGEEGSADISRRILTAAPAARDLFKRDTRTCGYVDGNSRISYTCHHSEAQCLYNTDAMAVGCCLTTNCLIITACVPYTSSAVALTMNTERTRYCSDPDFPHCAVYSYADRTGSLAGYTIQTCDSVSATHIIYFQPTTRTRTTSDDDFFTTSSPTNTRTTTSRETSTTDTETDTDPTPTTSSRDPSGTSSRQNEDDDDEPSTSSSAPVGAIVGGVIGGIAAIALLVLAIFFIVRKKKKDDDAANVAGTGQSPPGAPPATMASTIPPSHPPQSPYNPYPPQPAQVPYSPHTPQPGLHNPEMAQYSAYYDPRQSMLKPDGSPMHSHLSTAPVSPTSSPPPAYPPQGPAPHNGLGIGGIGMVAPTPPPPSPPNNHGHYMPYNPGPGGVAPHPPHGQFHNTPVEMPTTRGDGQLHELQ